MGNAFLITSAAFLLLVGTTPAFSQDRYRAGTLPQVNVNFSLTSQLKLNTKLETRQIVSERSLDEPGKYPFRYERTDLALVLTKKMAINTTLGGGYLIRLEDRQFVHRFIQQATLVNDLDLITVAHRLVVDETVRPDEPLEVRLRYRLGLEKALNGRQIDPKELYVKVTNEYLGILSANTTDAEIRALLALGYSASKTAKIELGAEYRVNEFYQSSKAHQYWATIAWFISL